MLTGMGLALGIDSRSSSSRATGRADARKARAVGIEGLGRDSEPGGCVPAASSSSRCSGCAQPQLDHAQPRGRRSSPDRLRDRGADPPARCLCLEKVNALRIPFVGRRSLERSNPEGRFWGAIVRRVLRRPWLSLALSTGLLIALALPVLTMDIGTTVSALARPLRLQGFVALARSFPGTTTDPAEIVVRNASDPGVSRAGRPAPSETRRRSPLRPRPNPAFDGR